MPPRELVFYPTLAEVQSLTFGEYVEKLERESDLLQVGIARIVAPDGWAPRASYEGVDFVVPRPVRQHASGGRGVYRTCLLEERQLSLLGPNGFKEKAEAPEAQAPGGPGADVDVRAPAPAS